MEERFEKTAEKFPDPTLEELHERDPELLRSIIDFGALPPEFQEPILADTKKHREAGMSLEDILYRVKELVSKSKQLDGMDSSFSDINHIPLESREEMEARIVDLMIKDSVRSILKEIRRIIVQDSANIKGYKN